MKKYAAFMGKILFFQADEEIEVPMQNTGCGDLYDPLNALTLFFRENISYQKGEMVFHCEKAKEIYERLLTKKKLYLAEGKRNKIYLLPVGNGMGFLSQSFPDSDMAVNSSFFVMNLNEFGSIYDYAGIPIGLMIEGGKILSPPQFGRQAFLVRKDGTVSIETVRLGQVSVGIGELLFEDGRNCEFIERPAQKKTGRGKTDIVLVDSKVVAVHRGGGTQIPCGGFVIRTDLDVPDLKQASVSYHGMEDVEFGIQVGNSAIVDGVKTDRFLSPFYKVQNLFSAPYPPSMYPQNYKKARAPRILFGADISGKPMVAWIEGAGKFGHVKQEEGAGASLSESAEIAEKIGMHNAVHLDGGGSAQILVRGKKELKVSDRDPTDYSENERAIPLALVFKG